MIEVVLQIPFQRTSGRCELVKFVHELQSGAILFTSSLVNKTVEPSLTIPSGKECFATRVVPRNVASSLLLKERGFFIFKILCRKSDGSGYFTRLKK